MATSPTPARMLTLLGVVALFAVQARWGSQHVLSACGLIAIVVAVCVSLSLSGSRPVSNSQAAIGALVGIAVAALCGALQWHLWVARMTPALAQFLLAALVARTLRPQQMPVITRIAKAMRPDYVLGDNARRLTRQSTWCWLGLFVVLGVLNTTVALWRWPVAELPLPMGVFDACVAGVFLVLEFGYHHWRKHEHTHNSLWRFLLDLRHLNPLRLLLQR